MKALLCLISLVITASVYGQETPKDTLEWSVLLGGKRAGFMKKWERSSREFTEWFQFNDRGRGDSTMVEYRLDENGNMVEMKGQGVDYFKKPIYESYRVAKGKASWSNPIENEEREISKPHEYLPLNISAGTSYRHYFNSPDSSIALLPAGRLKVKVLAHYKPIDGPSLRLMEIRGAGLTPSHSWIDSEDEFFAYANSWFGIIRAGEETLMDSLIAKQRPYEEAFFFELNKKLKQPIASGLAIENISIYDPVYRRTKNGKTILIKEGKIEAIQAANEKLPDNYRRIDGTGRMALPGLWDMHVHYGDHTDGLLHIGSGITHVRDMGNGEDLLSKKKEIEAGQVIGPVVEVISGFIDGAGPYAGPTGAIINSKEEGIEAIQVYAKDGYKQIKLYSSLKPEWVAPLAREAHRLGLRVSGHIPAFMLAEEAIEAGYDEIQHANMLFLNFYGKELDTRTPVRFSEVAKRAAVFDFEAESFKQFVTLLKDNEVAIDPTVSIFEDMYKGTPGEPNPSFADVIHRLPTNTQRYLKSGSSLEIPEGLEATYSKSFDKILELVYQLYANKVRILPGTDGFAGFTLHRELINYARAGIPNEEVLYMATLGAAEVADKSDKYGQIISGRPADLIIVEGNPLLDMENIRKVEWVIMGETLLRAPDVHKAVSISSY